MNGKYLHSLGKTFLNKSKELEFIYAQKKLQKSFLKNTSQDVSLSLAAMS
jgi:hypothetical protein